jgi:hypothetical protein
MTLCHVSTIVIHRPGCINYCHTLSHKLLENINTLHTSGATKIVSESDVLHVVGSNHPSELGVSLSHFHVFSHTKFSH